MNRRIMCGAFAVATVAAATSGVASAQSFNPTAAAKGFNVFTTGAVTIVGGDTHGPLAIGGNLILAGNAPLAMNTSGIYPSDTLNSTSNYGLVINGRVQYNSGGSPTYLSKGLVRIANTTGTTLYDYDNNNSLTGLQLTSGAFNSTPRVEKQNGWQDKTTATQAHGLNFATAATQMAQASGIINGYVTTNCQGKINTIPVPTCNSCNPQLALQSGKVNFMNVTTQAQLSGLLSVGSLNMMSANGVKPAANSPMIFNVTISGAVTFTVPNMSSVSGNDGPYILWNFPNATSISFGNGAYNNTVYGTILAPQASLVKDGGNNFEGQVLTASFSLNTGEVHYQPFAVLLPQCSAPLAIENLSLRASRRGRAVELSWHAEDAKGEALTLERSADGKTWADIATALRGEEFVDGSAPASRAYYRLRATRADAAVRYSTVEAVASISSLSDVSATPNPFVGEFTIIGDDDVRYAALLDAAGRTLATANPVNGKISFEGLSALPVGLYLVRTTNGVGEVAVQKVVKQ